MRFISRVFQEAIQQDPNYALAYSGLADAYALLTGYTSEPPRELMPKAKDAAIRALALDDKLAEAHASMGQIAAYYDYDFPTSEREYRRAARSGWKDYLQVSLDQMLSRGSQRRFSPFLTATFYARLGRKDEAIQWLEKGFEERDGLMMVIGVSWELDNLRSDERFKQLMRRMGLPE